MNKIMNNSYLYVDLEQLRRNVETLLEELGPGVQLIPVLKGDAYGLGLGRIGAELAGFREIKTMAAAHVWEGMVLRQAGVKQDILVLGIVPTRLLPQAVAEGLTLTLGRLGQAADIAGEARRQNRRVKVQIKVETGMHRIGLMPGAEMGQLIGELRQAGDWLQVTGAFTHFADAAAPEACREQVERYLSGVEQLEQSGIAIPMRHVEGSAASEYYPQYRMDGVRLGRRLYMDHPTKPLGNIGELASWRTWITNLRRLKAGDTLGYGGHYHLERDAQVATIGVGYGDGLNEELVHAHGPVLVNGRRVPLLACCMDQSFVDVTGLDCRVDDEVTLFGYDGQGNFLSSQEVSLVIGDNEGCGLTAALSGRVARVYGPAQNGG